MQSAVDEFSFLASDAARVGVTTLPDVHRLAVQLDEGAVSGLAFGSMPPTFTFLHGAGLNAHTFDPTILALGYPSLSFDLPGHGKSAWREDADYQPVSIAPALASAIDVMAATPQILVGHSLGGLTALHIAATHPELVSHLVMIDITPGVSAGDGASSVREFIGGRSTYDTVDQIIDRAIEYKIGHDRDALRRGITLNTRVRDDGKLEWTHHLAHLLAQPEGIEQDKVFKSETEGGHRARWADIPAVVEANIPVTLIRGETGMVSETLANEWLEHLPHSTMHSVKAGHNVQEHAPRELAQILSHLTSA